MSDTALRLGQLAITVSDVELALKFYRNILGMHFLFSPSPNMAFLMCGEVRFMLSTPQGAGKVGENSIPYFNVVDIDTFYSNAIARGAMPSQAPQCVAEMSDHNLWIGFVKDPDGNVVGLMEEKDKRITNKS